MKIVKSKHIISCERIDNSNQKRYSIRTNVRNIGGNMATKSSKNINDKDKALAEALEQIEKQYGKGAIMKMGDDGVNTNISTIPTGSISLDLATGVRGYPRGRIVEIYGPESSGKTTLALHAIAEAQKMNGKAAFIDAEHALDPVYAANLGVNVDELLVSQPDTGEQALEICEMLARSGAIDIIVIDSVAALVPKAEIQGDMGDSHVGLQARLMSQALRKIAGAVNKSNTCVIFINQLREKIGIVYGNPETTTGGRALKFYATIRIEVRRGEAIKKGDETLGNRTKIKIVKNKVAPPFRKAEFDIMYGEGISISGDVLDVAVENDIIDKAGSWYSYHGERIGQGRENVKIYLQNNEEILIEIKNQIVEIFKPKKEEIKVDEDGVVIE